MSYSGILTRRSNLEQTREHLDVDSRRLGDWQSELERVEPALAQLKTLSREADTGLPRLRQPYKPGPDVGSV